MAVKSASSLSIISIVYLKRDNNNKLLWNVLKTLDADDCAMFDNETETETETSGNSGKFPVFRLF